MKIVLAGASGFIGSALLSHFQKRGIQVIALSRKNRFGMHYWNPETKEIDSSLLEGAHAVINLAGESIFGRWTEGKKSRMRSSRLLSSNFLTQTLLELSHPPKLYIGASAVGYYGDCGERELTESMPPGEGFAANLCQEWESYPRKLVEVGVRVVFARFGVVFGRKGGAFKKMITPFRLGLGGTFGTGKQIVSWIALEDLVRAIDHVLLTPSIAGPVNFVSPEPVSNYTLTKTLGRLVHRPTFFPLPKRLLEWIFGEGAQFFLWSQKVKPKVLLETGFAFHLPTIEEALKKCLLIKE